MWFCETATFVAEIRLGVDMPAQQEASGYRSGGLTRNQVAALLEPSCPMTIFPERAVLLYKRNIDLSECPVEWTK